MRYARLIVLTALILAVASCCPAVVAAPEDDPLGGWVPLDNVWITDYTGETALDGSGPVPDFADITKIRATIAGTDLVIEFYILNAKSDGNLKFAVFVDWGTAGDPPAENFDFEDLLSTQNYDYHLQRENTEPYFRQLQYVDAGDVKTDTGSFGSVAFTPNGEDLFTCIIPLSVFPNSPAGSLPTRISIITQSTKDAPPYDTVPLFGGIAIPGALATLLVIRRIRGRL